MTDEPVVEMEWISAQVPKELAQAFRAMARGHERTVSAELRLAMRVSLAAAATEKKQAA